MTSADEKVSPCANGSLPLMVAAGVLLSPMFSFPLGVTKAFPLQHMINIFLAVLCGTRYGTAAAFGTSLIRNLLAPAAFSPSPAPWWALSSPATSTATRTSSGCRHRRIRRYLDHRRTPLLPDRRPLHGLGQRRLLLRLPLRRLLRRRLRHRLRRPEGHESDSNRILEDVRKQKAQFPHRRLGFLCGLTLKVESRDE